MRAPDPCCLIQCPLVRCVGVAGDFAPPARTAEASTMSEHQRTPLRPRERAPTERRGNGEDARKDAGTSERPREIGGRKGPEPTRFGDWEKNGRCIDF